MNSRDSLRTALGFAIGGAQRGLSMADRLCFACVELLEVDGAAISLMHGGTTQGTFGSSGELSRRLDELQFTFGEGPCLEAVELTRPVLVTDFQDPEEQRWPAFGSAALGCGVRAAFALPIALANSNIGALNLFRCSPGPLSDDGLAGGLLAARLAALPLLDLMTEDVDWREASEVDNGWEQLASLERVEVYQATGMVMGQLDVGAAEALVRLRAHAFAQNLTVSDAAWSVIERRLTLETDDHWRMPGDGARSFS